VTILALGEVLMELRRAGDDGAVALPGSWLGPFCSGAPAIFASVAARLGARVALAGGVGNDAFGRRLRERLEGDGVETSLLATVPGRATALAMVAYDAGGGRDFFFSVRGSAAEGLDGAAVPRAAARAGWIHVSGSSIGFGDPLAAAVEGAVAAGLRGGARLSLDPNLRPDAPAETLARTAALARRASVTFPSPGELEALGLTAAELVGRGTVVCATQGAAGVELHTGPAPVHIAAPAVREVDPTGAGDHFAGAFLAAFAGARRPRARDDGCLRRGRAQRRRARRHGGSARAARLTPAAGQEEAAERT
jgi:sugar/nucleoside kinase (ribokinase family)